MQETIRQNPFITDEELAEKYHVSVQTIRLDRLELSIPELRERIKNVAEKRFANEVRALPIEEVVGEVIDIELDRSAISIFDVKKEHVFKRNAIARGHHLFAQANSLAVAVIDDELALTAKATIRFCGPRKSATASLPRQKWRTSIRKTAERLCLLKAMSAVTSSLKANLKCIGIMPEKAAVLNYASRTGKPFSRGPAPRLRHGRENFRTGKA